MESQLVELKALAEKNDGVLHPEAVVGFARNPKTALHSAFEWNNTKAAEQYRIEQARRLIRVMVEVVPGDSKETTVNAFVALRSERYEEAGYRYMPELMKTEAGREDVLATALWELAAAARTWVGVEGGVDLLPRHQRAEREVLAWTWQLL